MSEILHGNWIEKFTDQIWRKLFDIGFPIQTLYFALYLYLFQNGRKIKPWTGLLRVIYYFVHHLVHETSTNFFRIRTKLAKIEFCVKFLYKMVYVVFWRKNYLKRSPVKICLEKLPGETLCKFFQIFPPKDLVYFWRKISSHFLIALSDLY